MKIHLLFFHIDICFVPFILKSPHYLLLVFNIYWEMDSFNCNLLFIIKIFELSYYSVNTSFIISTFQSKLLDRITPPPLLNCLTKYWSCRNNDNYYYSTFFWCRNIISHFLITRIPILFRVKEFNKTTTSFNESWM